MIALLTSGTVVGREHAGERKEAGSTSIKNFIMFLITVTGNFISTMYWRCHREGWLERGRGRVGPEAVPTGLPTPGNLFLDGDSETAGTATTDLAEGVADTATLEIEDEATETAAD